MNQSTLDKVISFLNDEQRDAILCDTNCVVTAGAGSGKTSVLTYRFFRLVATGKAQVDEILTLTFTKKAAAEMYERIYDLLIAYKDDSTIKEQLEKFSTSTISTIDSFCYQVLLSDTRRFGLSPDFVLDIDSCIEIAKTSAHETFKNLKDHTVMKFLSATYDPQTLIDKVFVSLALENFYMGDIYLPEKYTEVVETYIKQKRSDLNHKILKMSEYILESFDIGGKVAIYNKELIQNLILLLQDSSALISEKEKIDEIKKIRQTTTNHPEKEAYNELIVSLRESLPILISLTHAIDQRDILSDMYQVFMMFHDLYIERKRVMQVLTYNDIANMAKIILVENDEIRSKFSREFRYIMVDEFQDTNPLQKEIIYLLSTTTPVIPNEPISVHSLTKDKLFFVGDEKQSIYAFRGADVRVFKKLHQEITSSGGRHITLKKNYRSQKQLITLFNLLFEKVFSDPTEDFEAIFTPLLANKENSSLHPKATFAIIPYEGDDDTASVEGEEYVPHGVEKEAIYIAQKIREMVNGDDYLIEEGGVVKRPSFKDIAILMRTTSPQMYYEKALRRAHIPYVLSSVKSLFLEAPLNDLYLILQLITYPEDLVSFASLLRSGFCNISDDEVIKVLNEGREQNILFPQMTWNDSSEKDKYDALENLYEEIYLLSKKEKVSSLLSYIWYNGGYRNHLLISPSYRVYLEHFDYILELALDIERRGGNILTFLDYVRPRLGQSEKMGEIEILPHGFDGVNIMTIHKSKGLEFPIVIIANAGGGSRGIATPPLYYHEYLDTKIPIPHHMIEDDVFKNIVFQIEKPRIELSESAELKRLLYVAFTRAKDHLLVTTYDNNKSMKEKNIGKNFFSMITYNYQDSKDKLFTFETIDSFSTDDKEIDSRSQILSEARSRSVWYQKREEETTYIQRVHGVTSLEPYQEQQKEIDENFLTLASYKSDEILEKYTIYNLFGTWTHGAFEYTVNHLSPIYTYDETILNKKVLLSLIPQELSSLPIVDSELTILSNDIFSMVNSFFKSDFYRSLLQRDLKSIESEVPFISRVKYKEANIVVNGVIDLLLHYKDHVVIVDFKTDKIVDPLIHKNQLELYSQAIQKIYNQEVKAVLCYVRQVGNEKWL